MPKKTPTQRMDDLEHAVATGAPVGAAKLEQLDRAKLGAVVKAFPELAVALKRMEQQGGLFAKTTKTVEAGFFPRINSNAVLNIGDWIYEQAGGGRYDVELMNPDDLTAGPHYSFFIEIPGAPRQPTTIATKEYARAASTNDQISNIANQLIKGGTNPAAAFDLAHKMMKESPALAQTFSLDGSGNNNEDDDMSMMKMMMMLQMQQSQQRAEEEERRYRRDREQQPKTNPEITALRAMVEKQTQDAERERRRNDEQRAETRHQSDIQSLRTEIQTLSQNNTPRTDWSGIIGAAATAFGGMVGNQNRASQESTAAIMQVIEKVLPKDGDKKDQLQMFFENALKQSQFDMEARKARLEEPLMQVDAMSKMSQTIGGMITAFVDMQVKMNPNEPAWMEIARSALTELPSVAHDLLSPDATREIVNNGPSTPTVDQQMAQAQQMIKPVKPTPEVVEAAEDVKKLENPKQTLGNVEQIVESEVVATIDQKAALVASELGEPVIKDLIEREEWAKIIGDFVTENVDVPDLAERLVTQIIKDDGKGLIDDTIKSVVAYPDQFANILMEKLHWTQDMAEALVEGIKNSMENKGLETAQNE